MRISILLQYTANMVYFIRAETNSPEKRNAASRLKANMTETERILWDALRNNQLSGLHFRRQHIISGFVVDFYCHKARLIVELDGEIHLTQQEYDRFRTEALEAKGLHVIRFTNEEIHSSLNAVLIAIDNTCQYRLQTLDKPPPFPRREGG